MLNVKEIIVVSKSIKIEELQSRRSKNFFAEFHKIGIFRKLFSLPTTNNRNVNFTRHELTRSSKISWKNTENILEATEEIDLSQFQF